MAHSQNAADGAVMHSRENNEWIERMCDAFALGEPVSSYVCECGDVLCKANVDLTRVEYERIRSVGTRFVIQPNHENPEVDVVTEENDTWAILEKLPGTSARAAEDSDPRRISLITRSPDRR